MAALAESRPVQVLNAALAKGRLPHAILLFGDNLDVLESVAHTLAGKLLETDKPIRTQADFFALRPANKMRQIGVEATRQVITRIHQTPGQAPRKVAVIYEADRMRREAANAFLKTLEEPPGDTTILLLSTRPYDLLPTIRSRCMHLRLPSGETPIAHEGWRQTCADYRKWLGQLSIRKADPLKTADLLLGLYGLVTRFSALIKVLSGEAWQKEKAQLPEDLGDEQVEAIEIGFRKGLRSRLLTEIEQETRDFAHIDPAHPPTQALAHSVQVLEKANGLLEVNFNEAAALELFLLQSLRIWSGPRGCRQKL